MNESPVIGALDIGGTKIALGLVDPTGQLLQSDQFATQIESTYSDCFELIRARLADLCRRSGLALAGIGIGCTGRMDADGVFFSNPFLPCLEGHNLAGDLGRSFGVAAGVENDADAAALGEYRWGSGRRGRSMIFLTVSTGIGGGVILNGQLLRGLDGCHPELGHHVIEPDGPACFCGAHGCWESLASGTAFGKYGGQTAGPAYAGARAICDLAEQGDETAQKLVQREAHYLGIGLANLISLFAPETIVLGGGLMSRWDLFATQAQAVIAAQCGLVPWQKVRLVPASLGSRTGLLGAAAVWLQRFTNPASAG